MNSRSWSGRPACAPAAIENGSDFAPPACRRYVPGRLSSVKSSSAWWSNPAHRAAGWGLAFPSKTFGAEPASITTNASASGASEKATAIFGSLGPYPAWLARTKTSARTSAVASTTPQRQASHGAAGPTHRRPAPAFEPRGSLSRSLMASTPVSIPVAGPHGGTDNLPRVSVSDSGDAPLVLAERRVESLMRRRIPGDVVRRMDEELHAPFRQPLGHGRDDHPDERHER